MQWILSKQQLHLQFYPILQWPFRNEDVEEDHADGWHWLYQLLSPYRQIKIKKSKKQKNDMNGQMSWQRGVVVTSQGLFTRFVRTTFWVTVKHPLLNLWTRLVLDYSSINYFTKHKCNSRYKISILWSRLAYLQFSFFFFLRKYTFLVSTFCTFFILFLTYWFFHL